MMGLFSSNNDNGCTAHHFPDEWIETDKLDVITKNDINTYEEEDHFCVEIYRKHEKKCLHENCTVRKKEWRKISSINQKRFIEEVENNDWRTT